MNVNAWQKDFLAKKHCNTIMWGGGGCIKLEKEKKFKI